MHIFFNKALFKILNHSVFKSHQIKELKIWCDNTKNFKNQELFYDLHKFGDEYGWKIKVNCFAEKHGKGYCDGRFGVIKRFIRDYTNKKEKKSTQHRILWLPFNIWQLLQNQRCRVPKLF
jgi:hypothetical protein